MAKYVKKNQPLPKLKDTLEPDQIYLYDSLVTFYCTNLKTEGHRRTMKGSFAGLLDLAIHYPGSFVYRLSTIITILPYDSAERIEAEQVLVALAFQTLHNIPNTNYIPVFKDL